MDKVVLYLIGFFFIVGGLDYILGNSLKLGAKFEEGIKTMGALGLGMIGIYSLAPVLSNYINILVVPICQVLKLDPSIFPAAVVAMDMGGYQMATKVALTEQMGLFSGVIIASSLGATISFSIPIALGMIAKEDEDYFAQGVIAGIITIPAGCVVAGLWQRVELNLLLWNLMPIFAFTIALVIGMIKARKLLMAGFNLFGRLIIGLSIIGLLLQGVNAIFDIKLIEGMTSLSEATAIVGKIAIVLGGAYVMLEFFGRLFKKSIERIGDKLGINSVAVVGLMGNLASNLVVFGAFKDMDPKGKVICTAFGVSGAFVFGGQFGFIAGIIPEMLAAFIICKLVGGLLSIMLSSWLYNKETISNSK